MFSSNQPDANLLQSILEPLLEDFQYWFERSRLLFETEEIAFLTEEHQADLIARIMTAQQEVRTAQMLFNAMGGQVGIESSILVPWHDLVTECWQIAMRHRLDQSQQK